MSCDVPDATSPRLLAESLYGSAPNLDAVPELGSIEELLGAYLILLDNFATFLVTVALIYAVGRFVALPVLGLALELRGTERTQSVPAVPE